ncbi:MAG: HNH endonuclease [Dehalococcoidia bacterium]
MQDDDKAQRERDRNRRRLRHKRRTDAAFNRRQNAGKRQRRRIPRVRAAERAREAVRRARRLAREAGIPIRTNAELRLLADWILAVEQDPCSYCHHRVDRVQIDHIVPLIRDPDWRWTNSAPACPRCNASKGDRPWWLAYSRLAAARATAERAPACRTRSTRRRRSGGTRPPSGEGHAS